MTTADSIRFLTYWDVIKLRDSDKPRPRINLHDSPSAPVQKMVWIQRRGEEKPPHANLREMTKIVLAGECELRIFDNEGKLMDSRLLHPRGTFSYTLAAGVWHQNIALTAEVVFMEVMPGPYVQGDVIYPAWLRKGESA